MCFEMKTDMYELAVECDQGRAVGLFFSARDIGLHGAEGQADKVTGSPSVPKPAGSRNPLASRARTRHSTDVSTIQITPRAYATNKPTEESKTENGHSQK